MDEKISILDYWRIVWRWKKHILALTLGASLFAAVISLCLPKIYTTQATLMPIGGSSRLSATSGAIFGTLLGQLGMGGMGTTATQLLTILKSRTLAERVIENYNLHKILCSNLWDEKEKRWKVRNSESKIMEASVHRLHSQILSTEDFKTGILTIKGQFEDPELAARVVNGYITELADYLNENAFTAAKRNRIFIGEQLERNKIELLESGKELTDFYAKKKISNVDPTLDVNVSLFNSPRSEVTEGETYAATPQEPMKPPQYAATEEMTAKDGVPGIPEALAQASQRTDDLLQQKEGVESKIREAKIVKNVPQQIYLQYLLLRRELLGQVNSLLIQQYEIAQIEEAKEDLNFEVVDWARVPMTRFKPKRRQIVTSTFMVSLFASICLSFFLEYLTRKKQQN